MRLELTRFYVEQAKKLASKKRLTGKEIQASQKMLAYLAQAFTDLHRSIVVEPEFADSMPEEMFTFIKESKENAEKTFRAVVVQSKQGILQRFDKEEPIENKKKE